MGRIRTTKPEYYRHERLFEAERTSGLPLRVAFSGLFTVADREGRFHWRPRVLKLDVLPFDDLDFENVLNALVEYGFIRRYEVGGESFGCIPTFLKHQVINQREAQSALPAPPELQVQAPEAQVQKLERTCTHVQTHGEVEGKGKEVEGKRKEKSKGGAIAPLPFVPPDWIPREAWEGFIEMRKKLRAPITDKAKELIVKDLDRLKNEGQDPREVLEQSIKKAWRGVFTVKQESAGSGHSKSRNAVNSGRGTDYDAGRTNVEEL